MDGFSDVVGFKICIQVCVWHGFQPLKFNVSAGEENYTLKIRIIHFDVWKVMSSQLENERESSFALYDDKSDS